MTRTKLAGNIPLVSTLRDARTRTVMVRARGVILICLSRIADQYYKNLVFIERKNRRLMDQDDVGSEQHAPSSGQQAAADNDAARA